MSPAVLVNLLDEVAQHLLRDVEICDHSVLQGADGLDGAGRAAQHPLGLDPHRMHLRAAGVDGHHGGLREHDPPPPDIDERIGGPEVHGHVSATHAGEVREEAHQLE
jgi:hypothetical protein